PSMGQQKFPEIGFSQFAIMKEATKADAAIISFGRQAGEGIDREIEGDFNLTPDEMQLLTEVTTAFHQAGKPVIVIINSGSVIETASWKSLPDAILVAWQPGMEGGNSVADILTGKANPSGKLTMTWPLHATDHPSTKNFPQPMDLYTYNTMYDWNKSVSGYQHTNHDEDIYVGYRYFDTFGKDVSYPFGYGLSYTDFEYSKPAVSRKGDEIIVSVTVKNTGKTAGKEVVQVYVTAPDGTLEKPAKELKTFGKTRELQPGESETLRMTLRHRDLASFDEEQSAWVVDPGTYKFHIAASAADVRATVPLTVDGFTEKTTDALKPQMPLHRLTRK
ncbi:MAG: glycoside hydrolase family 3 C-terminal domain-containing protein, partial [Muribaculaceae bacterium]|nr:glycoside hydrolase family 3 C-terminal domain-containing protein [Muribaculaceae bacterium]